MLILFVVLLFQAIILLKDSYQAEKIYERNAKINKRQCQRDFDELHIKRIEGID